MMSIQLHQVSRLSCIVSIQMFQVYRSSVTMSVQMYQVYSISISASTDFQYICRLPDEGHLKVCLLSLSPSSPTIS